jgi:hypothetical protein
MTTQSQIVKNGSSNGDVYSNTLVIQKAAAAFIWTAFCWGSAIFMITNPATQ